MPVEVWISSERGPWKKKGPNVLLRWMKKSQSLDGWWKKPLVGWKSVKINEWNFEERKGYGNLGKCSKD